MKSKKGLTVTLGVAGAGVLLLFLLGVKGCADYNRIITADETATQTWGNVQSDLQRRSDLIPNLVATVKGAAKHENETLTAVIRARSQATSVQVAASDLSNPEAMQSFVQAQQQLSGALSRLLVTVEKYPELRANQNFQDLQIQLEGSENRINISRKRYNEAVQRLNVTLRRFPLSVINRWFAHVQPKTPFEAAPQAAVAPAVEF